MTTKPADTTADNQTPTSNAWIASEIGDTLAGEVVDVTFNWSDQRQGDYPLITVLTSDGEERKLHCFATALYNEAMRQRIVPGERITVTFLGVGEPKRKGQNGAKRYSFRVEGRSRESYLDMYDRAENKPIRGGQSPNGAAPGQPSPVPEPDGTHDEDIPF